MSLTLTPRIERIAGAVTGRRDSLFREDLERHSGALDAALRGARVLVAGGAGTIGSATIAEIVARRPAAVTVLDPSENNLAELVRTLRSQPVPFAGGLAVQPLGYGTPLAARYLAELPPHDFVLSFAALKHVRSGRDRFSLARMLEVNLLDADRFLAACRAHGHGARGIFMVSTDKAARPASWMGASKRAMEMLLWSADEARGNKGVSGPRVTAARFANVAFSDGSLPWSFLQRIEKRQPLALPADVRRYLMSPREAGQLCLLTAVAAPSATVTVPALEPDRDEVGFDTVAEMTLRDLGLEPERYADEHEARGRVAWELARGRYPVVMTRSDTDGEKPREEFACAGEDVRDIGFAALRGIDAQPGDETALAALLDAIQVAVGDGHAGVPPDLEAALARVVPELRRRVTGRSLDEKM
ncbi:MAG: polysaccharide biosynthesis protein [Myxococcota bacterium]